MGEFNFKTDAQIDEQREASVGVLAKYLKELEDAVNGKELVAVKTKVLKLQSQEDGRFLFPKGGSKEFWDKYHGLRDIFQKQAIIEVKAEMEDAQSKRALKRLKWDIGQNPVLNHEDHKKPFWEECEIRIAELEAA